MILLKYPVIFHFKVKNKELREKKVFLIALNNILMKNTDKLLMKTCHDQSLDSEQEEDCSIGSEWKEDVPKVKTFAFNERPENLPGNADPMFFIGLMC